MHIVLYIHISDWIACFTSVLILCFLSLQNHQANKQQWHQKYDWYSNEFKYNYFVGSELFWTGFFGIRVLDVWIVHERIFISFVMSFTSRFCCLLFRMKITISITILEALACNLCRAEAIIHPPTDILWNIQFKQNN